MRPLRGKPWCFANEPRVASWFLQGPLMNRSCVLRRERAGSIYRLAFVVTASRLGSMRRGAVQCVGSMVNEKSVSRDNRVQRSDNAYIIVGEFLYLEGGSVRKLPRRCTKTTTEFNNTQWIYPLRRYILHSLTLQRHNESLAELGGISQHILPLFFSLSDASFVFLLQ